MVDPQVSLSRATSLPSQAHIASHHPRRLSWIRSGVKPGRAEEWRVSEQKLVRNTLLLLETA
ncbi:MAG: hypothetical protein HY391_06050 [Deltaproteobacteria bacterium]|nr:hypothetical protein [Deltaproteobacteria bacterium]